MVRPPPSEELQEIARSGALGRARLAAGDAAGALAAFRAAVERAAGLPDEGVFGRALGELGVALSLVGDRALADRTLDAALALVDEAGDGIGAAIVAQQRARACAGAPAVALAAWHDAERRCARAGLLEDALRARIGAARIASAAGDVAAVIDRLEPAVVALDRALDEDATWARGALGVAWLAQGSAAQAEPLLDRAAREASRAGQRADAARWLHHRNLCRALRGRE
jgi:tetratricopeptide (TPR) repeat protein